MNDHSPLDGFGMEAGNHNPTYILEIGPGANSLLGDWFKQFANPKVVFVAPKKNKNFVGPIAGAPFVEADIMDFVHGHASIPPSGFEYIVAQNVISASVGKLNNLDNFVQGLSGILRPSGTVIIEESYSNVNINTGRTIAGIFEAHGFRPLITNDQNMFLSPQLWHKNSFHLEAYK